MSIVVPTFEASAEVISRVSSVKGICFDIDDTFSSHGKITDEAFTALWSLKRAGYWLVPITGRPAGWCDHFARFWPVDAVIGENGAFAFFMEKGVRKREDTPHGSTSDKLKTQIGYLEQKILARFPHAKWASDQAYREFDLAIDFCEDVEPWTRAQVDELLGLCHGLGAYAKLSSIHVNAWFGDYDKQAGFKHWLETVAPRLAEGREVPAWNEWLFIGDSPNDEPLFKSFDLSVGVANLKNYLDRVQHAPKWITASESGAGFAEMAKVMLTSSFGRRGTPGDLSAARK